MSKQASHQAVKEELETVEAVKAPAAPVETAPVNILGQQKRKGVYALFINDQTTSVGQTNAPVGNWHCMYIDTVSGVAHGPYPMMVPTSRGQIVLSGYVSLDNLRPVAQKMYADYSKDGWKEPFTPLDLSANMHKIMSSIISV